MTIDDLKRALVEVREICQRNDKCQAKCPFCNTDGDCMFSVNWPEDWKVEEIKEDTHETDC